MSVTGERAIQTHVAAIAERIGPETTRTTARKIGRYCQLLRTRDGVKPKIANAVYWALRARYYPRTQEARTP